MPTLELIANVEFLRQENERLKADCQKKLDLQWEGMLAIADERDRLQKQVVQLKADLEQAINDKIDAVKELVKQKYKK